MKIKMKPILFNTEMTRATRSKKKTRTRRFAAEVYYGNFEKGFVGNFIFTRGVDGCDGIKSIKPQYQVGDVLYMRETYTNIHDKIYYKADMSYEQALGYRWHPSIHMPKKYAQTFLKITSVLVERLQDITFEDIFREGFPGDMKDYFISTRYKDPACTASTPKEQKILSWWVNLWNSTTRDKEKQWESNPYVLVYGMEITEKPQEI